MKGMTVLAQMIIALAACTRQSGSGTTDEIPGVKETFDDRAGLVKSTLRNAADQVTGVGFYLNGVKEGSWVEYDQSTLLKSVTTYMGGKKEGLSLEFGASSQVKVQSYYHNDMRHGEYREFNGSLVKEERYYEYDKLEGIVKIFYDDGKLMEESSYQAGQRNGNATWYDRNGNPTIKYIYKDGVLIKS